MTTRSQRGFTLFELLVAIAIFAIVAVMAYRGYTEAASLAERARIQTRRLAEVQRTIRSLVVDFSSLAPRPVREPVGDGYRPVLERDANANELVELSRGGWANTVGAPRGTVQRVRYRLDGARLLREYWVVTDPTLSTEPVTQELLDGVSAVELRYMDAAREWQTDWPDRDAPGETGLRSRPIAVEIVLVLEDYGRLRRIVEVPG